MLRATGIALLLVLGTASAHAGPDDPDPKLRELLIEAINDSASFEDRFHAEVWLMDF